MVTTDDGTGPRGESDANLPADRSSDFGSADFRAALTRAADTAGLGDAYDRLRDHLTDQAEWSGILDVAYRTVDTPVGALLVAATEQGLVRVAYPIEGHEKVLDALAGQVSPRVLRAAGRLDPVARQIDEYFAGHRRVFDVPLDMRLARGFRRLVLDHLREIGYGTTASYGTVAAAAGSPAAVRAVGTACARNPLPVVVPCHRVVLADGSIGRYVGGVSAKKALLELEAAA